MEWYTIIERVHILETYYTNSCLAKKYILLNSQIFVSTYTYINWQSGSLYTTALYLLELGNDFNNKIWYFIAEIKIYIKISYRIFVKDFFMHIYSIKLNVYNRNCNRDLSDLWIPVSTWKNVLHFASGSF